MRWLDLVKTLAPIITAAVIPNGGAVVGGLIAHGIEVAESIPNASGQMKLNAAKDLVNIGIAGINAASNKQVVDPTLVSSTSDSVINAVVQTANLVKNTPVKN